MAEKKGNTLQDDESDIVSISDDGGIIEDTDSLAFNFESTMSVGFEDHLNEETPIPNMQSFSNGVTYRKLNCNSILVSIEPSKRLYFAGKVIVQVLKGRVNIYGYVMEPCDNKYTVFSAKGHSSLLFIQGIAGNTSKDDFNFTQGSISKEEYGNSTGALIVLEGFENEWCDGVRQTHPQGSNFIGPSITGIGPGTIPLPKDFLDKLGFQFINNAKSDRFKLLELPSYFDNIFTDIIGKFECSSGKICPFGGKGVGKSTFVRWLTNRFLSSSQASRVVFIDLDPGQTEFTPPGILSVHLCSEPILGPNFTHLSQPLHSIFLGGVSVADTPVRYIKAVAKLFEFCSGQEVCKGIPWVINTMGWCRGLGVDFACEIVKVIRPDCVIQLTIDNESRSFPFLLNATNVAKHTTFLSQHMAAQYQKPVDNYRFLSVNSVCNRDNSNMNSWGANPKVSRELTIISYFADRIGSTDNCSLMFVVPCCVPLDSIAVGTMNSNLSYDDIISTLNGNLVALCEMSDSLFETVPGTNRKFIRKATNYSNNFIGYGIVRAVDKKTEVLYIVTTIQEADLILKANVVLSAGAVGLPLHLYVPKDKAVDHLPYVAHRIQGASTLHAPARKFFVPKRVVHPVLKNCLL